MLPLQKIGSLSSMHIKIKGVKVYVSKGKMYAYHRMSGTRLKSTPGSQEFFAEIARLNGTDNTTKPGSWGALVALYKESPKFTREIRPRTRADYDRVLSWLSPIGDMPLHEIERGFVVRLMDKAYDQHGWRFSNYVLSVMSAVFSWGWQRQHCDAHPAKGLKKRNRPKEMPRTNRPWTKDEWDLVTAIAAPHLLAPILLAGVLGWREGEIVTRRVTDYDHANGRVRRISSKNGKEVKTPVPTEVATALDAILPHNAITLLVNSRGKPWSSNGLRASFFKLVRWLEQQGLVQPGLTVHGLRHTCATRMKELGVSREIRKEWLGQETDEMAEHYSRHADMQKQFEGVADLLDKKPKNPMISGQS